MSRQNLSLGFPNTSDKNQSDGLCPGCKPQKMARGLKFRFRKKRDCTIYVGKTVNAQLICVFVFAYAKIRFSHDEAQIFCLHDYGHLPR